MNSICSFCAKLALALLLAFESAWADESIRLGVMAPLTGPAASSGRWIIQGVELAKDELTAPAAAELVIEVQDDLCTAQGGLNAFRALRSRGVSLIIGPVCNAAAVPILQAAEREGVTLIATGIPSRAVLEGGAAVHTVLPPISKVAETISRFAVEHAKSRFAVLYTPDEFGEENYRAFESNTGGQGIVHAEQFVPGSLDFKTFILKARERQADGAASCEAAQLRSGHNTPRFTPHRKLQTLSR